MKIIILKFGFILSLLPTIGFCQYPGNSEKDVLKDYQSYTYLFQPKTRWKYKYKLENGLIKIQTNYYKSKLTYREEFYYDQHDNLIRSIQTYSADRGKIADTTNIKLIYKDDRLTKKVTDYGVKEVYSDFDVYGKPKRIERESIVGPYKEIFEYDTNGNIIKSVLFNYYDLGEGKFYEREITAFRYDNWNNIIEIHRQFEPKRKFPIFKSGPFLYEREYYRYKYNKDGLWTKKYRTVEGKEYLFAKRKFK